jgi:hypothetical protein
MSAGLFWVRKAGGTSNLRRLNTKAGVSDYIVRFEFLEVAKLLLGRKTRGKEFVSVARLRKVAAAKAKTPQLARGLGVKAP